MSLLASGIALWIGIHLIPSLGIEFKQALVTRIGLTIYRILFALGILSAMAMIVLGWQSAQPTSIYIPPFELRWVTVVLGILAFVLLGSTFRPSRIGRVLRYPQLSAVVLWAFAHLLANGDSRSLVLFPGLATWALLMMWVMSRRDGPWIKPEAPALWIDIAAALTMILVALGVIVIHPQLTGMPVF